MFWLFDVSLTVYVTSLELGTENFAPDCLLDVIDGGDPELSEHIGLGQFTLISRSVALSTVISGGQKPHVGGSKSGRMKIITLNGGHHQPSVRCLRVIGIRQSRQTMGTRSGL